MFRTLQNLYVRSVVEEAKSWSESAVSYYTDVSVAKKERADSTYRQLISLVSLWGDTTDTKVVAS